MTPGFTPITAWHVFVLGLPLAGWLVLRPYARRRHITRWHNAGVAVAYWEELLFRGLVFDLALSVLRNNVPAIIVSSLLFGLFHLRNLWWASHGQVLYMCLYTALIVGPLLGVVRVLSGDIYLGIGLHYLNNLFSMLRAREVPTDAFLNARVSRQNWFERLFSGDGRPRPQPSATRQKRVQ